MNNYSNFKNYNSYTNPNTMPNMNLYNKQITSFNNQYKELLEKFKYSEIQALYCWDGLDNDLRSELMRNKFEIEEVPSAGRLSLTDKNIIVSLGRHK